MAILVKYLENLNLKVFEEKQEKGNDAAWAKSMFDPYIHNALYSTVTKKVFELNDYKKSQQFYAKIYRNWKEIISIAKGIKAGDLYFKLVIEKLEVMMDELPCPMTRLMTEKLFFPDNFNMVDPKL